MKGFRVYLKKEKEMKNNREPVVSMTKKRKLASVGTAFPCMNKGDPSGKLLVYTKRTSE